MPTPSDLETTTASFLQLSSILPFYLSGLEDETGLSIGLILGYSFAYLLAHFSTLILAQEARTS
ncbi:hypothetical protein BU23DRAFT_551623 [Bimuria novae-zelandiae CBS 107.79]|uniref:Uncharacterized protein n=1 Tax=Bimuria novae-zelandiae CBS 107.79 TaxID=1447943 RepID=A0A6A5VI84_9PLEO|nr:hypothetical protein BU23DRAFT_551623 [Bimuria novae-zelandiae CBS 107.79]